MFIDDEMLYPKVEFSDINFSFEKYITDKDITNIIYLGGGSNSVYLLNDEIVIKICKDPKLESKLMRINEMRYTKVLKKNIKSAIIPELLESKRDENGHLLRIYKAIRGVKVNINEIKTLDKVMIFEKELHNINIKLLPNLNTNNYNLEKKFIEEYYNIKNEVYKNINLFTKNNIDKIYKKYISLTSNINLSVVHGDFSEDNCIMNSDDKLIVLDFDDITYGDPAIDYALWYEYLMNTKFIKKLEVEYKEFIFRMKFYLFRIPLLYCLMSSGREKDKFIKFGLNALPYYCSERFWEL